ncbi:MAG: hypothetical protein EA360_08150 [Balneolaceae bacterium]|nr:MAG: hypothetical protein EA360_08150 [Balneolaceae bacterium]
MEDIKSSESSTHSEGFHNESTYLKGLLFNPSRDSDTILVTGKEIDGKLGRDSRISQNFIVWTTLFIYPLFSGLDYLYINHLWFEFLLLRIILLGVIFLSFEFSRKSKKFSSLPVHLMMGGVTLQMIIFSIYAPLFAHYFYLVLLSVSSVFVMAVMVWRSQHAIFQVIGAIVAYLILVSLLSETALAEHLESGGLFYMGVMVLSAFISALRYEFQGKNARIEIYQEKYREILQKEIRNIMVQRDELNTSLLSMEDLNIEKNRFINVASHGIKNPLSRIFGFLQLISIEFENLPKLAREYLEYIEDSAHEINEVLDRYVNLKAFNKEPAMKMEAVDLLPVLQKAYSKISHEADGRNISMNLEIPDEPVEILSDKLSLQQIFSSLFKYAIRLSSNNSEMKVVVETERGNVRIHITQTKSRIDIHRLNELFDALETLTKKKENAMGGQGLGLSLARVLTHKMNGHLYYSANPHSGIYFLVEFPLAEYIESEEKSFS